MAVIPNPVPKVNPFVGTGGSRSGVSKGALELAKEQTELQKGLAKTVSRIGSSPQAVAAGKVNPFTAEAQRIAAGSNDKATGALGALLNSPVGKGLLGAATVLGTAQRGIVSTLKEGYDLSTGGDASFDDWWKQTKDPNFGVGKLIKDAGGLTGNGFLDGVIGFVGDVATDPLTYVTFGAASFAGRAGRLALATKAAEASNIAKIPNLANKIDDIARVGEWALDDAERVLLGVEKGVRFGLGQRSVLIPKTGRVAEAVGSNWAKTRAAVGDMESAQKIMSKVLPASYSGDLMAVGRGALSGAEGRSALAAWTAKKHGLGADRAFGSKVAARHAELISELAASPYRSTVALVAEGSRPAVDDVERALADKLLAMQEDLFTSANEVATQFATKRGIAKEVGIRRKDGYGVHHSITDEAKAWTRKQSDAPTPEFYNVIRNGELTVDEVVSGVGPARMRKWVAGEVVPIFGDQPLLTGSINEINERSLATLGFKWFDDDSVTIMNNYMHSMGRQVNRTAAMDRLMDFGVDYVKPLLEKAVPDKELVKAWASAVSDIKKAERVLRSSVDRNTKVVVGALDKTRRAGEKAMAKGKDRVVATARQLDDANRALDSATAKLQSLQAAVDNAVGSQKAAMQEVIDSTTSQIEKMRGQIARNDGWRAESYDQLVQEYMRVFPNAKKVPTDETVLVERLRAASGRAEGILEKKIVARDKLSAQVNRLRKTAKAGDANLDAAEKQLAIVQQEIDNLRWVNEAASNAPYTDSGLVYMPVQGAERGAAVILDTSATDMLAQGADPSQVIAMRAPTDVLDVTNPETIEEFLAGFSDGIGEVIAQAARDIPNASPELERLGEEVAANLGMALERNSVDFVDPMFAQVYPEVVDMMDTLVQFKMAAFEAAQTGGDIPEYMISEMMNSVDDALEAFARTNDLPVGFGEQAVVDALGLSTANMGGTAVGVVVPASALNPMADLGETSLVMFRNSGWLSPENLDSAPSLLTDNPLYRNLALGEDRALQYEAGLAARREAANEALTETELQNMLTQQAIPEAEAARQAATAEVRQARTTAKRLEEGVEPPAAQLEKANKVTVYEKDPKTGARRRVVYTRESAERRVATMEKDVDKAVRKLDKTIQGAEAEVRTTPEGVTGSVSGAGGARPAVERAQRVVNKAQILAADAAAWEANAMPAYLDDIARVVGSINRSPVGGAAGESAGSWAMRSQRILEQVDEAIRLGDTELEATRRVMTQLLGDEADLAILESVTLPRAEMMLTAAQQGRIGAKMVDDIEKGWVAIQGLGVQMPKEMRDLMYPNLMKLKDPKEFGKVWEIYQEYNKFFKVYATLTPGFSIRNGLSATFMNYVAGVSTSSMKDGLKASIAYLKYGPDKFMDRLGLSASERKIYEDAFVRTSATGQGQTIGDIFAPVINGRANRIIKNKVTMGAAKYNEGVEFAARFAMALDDTRKGLNFDSGVQRISRFHFDYSDLSNLDRFMKNWVPFWVWVSRNIPLQMANMWTRPQTYALYNHLRDNGPTGEDMMLPKWLKEGGPIGIGGGFVFNPDLPMNRFQSQIEQLSDPKRLLGNLNPIAKLPFEAYSDTQFSTDIPFGDKPIPAKGLDLLAAALAAPFGGTERNAAGDIMIDPKLQYQLGNIIPPIARLQRLIPQAGLGGKESYADRQLSSILTFLGVPVRKVTDSEQRGETIRRQRELADLIARLRQQGYIPEE